MFENNNSPADDDGASDDPEVAEVTTPAAQTTPARTEPPVKVNLTDIPEFREFQRNADRARDQARADAIRLQQRLDALEEQQNRRELDELERDDPEVQNKKLRAKLDTLAQQRVADLAAARAAAQRDANIALVNRVLYEHGLSGTDPDVAAILAGASEPTDAAVAVVNADLGRLAAARLKAQHAEELKKAKSASRAEKIEALDEAGVTATATGNAGSVVPSASLAKQKTAFFKEWQQVMSRPQSPDYRNFQGRLRKAGLTLADLQK